MQKVNKPYVHDVVNALSQVVIEVLVAGGGDAEEGGTGEVVSKSTPDTAAAMRENWGGG